jgi:tetratricopeptide (TPR) repeat protein
VAEGGDRWTCVLVPLAAAAASLLAPGAAAGQVLAADCGALSSGGLGLLAWRGASGLGGVVAVSLFRAAVAAGAVLLARGISRGERGLDLAAAIVAAASFGLLLPWGPGCLLPFFFAATVAAGRRSAAGAALVALLWPLADPLFWLGAPAAALFLAGMAGRRGLAPLAAFLNPAGFLGLASQTAWVPLWASWIGHPAYAAPSPLGPVFWMAALAGTALVLEAWPRQERRAGALALLGASLILRPAAPLAPIGLLGGGGRQRSGAEKGGLLLGLAAAIPALWLLTAQGGGSLPPSAAAALEALPPGSGALLTEPEWVGQAAALPGGRVQPALALEELKRYRRDFPEGLAPPFQWEVVPESGLLLLRARYPEVRTERSWAPDWRLLDAGAGWALFGRLSGSLAPWAEAHALKAYDPFLPLPRDREAKETALGEALRLAGREPGFFQALRDAGRLETDLGRYERARGHLEAALALRPKDAQAWNDLGVALQLGGKAEEAAGAFERSIRLKPAEILPRMNLAGLEMARGNRGNAEFLLRGVVTADPAFYPAVRMLARLLWEEGRKREAAAVIGGIAPESRTAQDEALLREAKP